MNLISLSQRSSILSPTSLKLSRSTSDSSLFLLRLKKFRSSLLGPVLVQNSLVQLTLWTSNMIKLMGWAQLSHISWNFNSNSSAHQKECPGIERTSFRACLSLSPDWHEAAPKETRIKMKLAPDVYMRREMHSTFHLTNFDEWERDIPIIIRWCYFGLEITYSWLLLILLTWSNVIQRRIIWKKESRLG